MADNTAHILRLRKYFIESIPTGYNHFTYFRYYFTEISRGLCTVGMSQPCLNYVKTFAQKYALVNSRLKDTSVECVTVFIQGASISSGGGIHSGRVRRLH